MPLKIAIVVHGRFHAFDLAREMIRQGVEVTLLTNYPKRVVEQFGISRDRVLNCVAHGVACRLAQRLGLGKALEAYLHRSFPRWAVRVLSGMDIDVIHSFSGVSEEILRAFPNERPLNSLVRGSAHIRTQARLLMEEERRCGQPLDRPSQWMIERELREYELANLIFVLSSFAHKSFIEEGASPEHLRLLPLGSELKRFRPVKQILEERCRRIESSEPLRVLTVGSFSFRKGALDLVEISHRLKGRMRFRFVGDVPGETRNLKRSVDGTIEFISRQPQFELPKYYNEADVFLFPTIEDGYAAVLAQAQAAGLPILATGHCAAADLVREDETGWVLPIRSPDAFVERLHWCDQNRGELSAIVRRAYDNYQSRDWSDVAKDLAGIYEAWFDQHQTAQAAFCP